MPFRIAETIFFARIGTGAAAIVGVSLFWASARSIFENALSVSLGVFNAALAREKNMALSFNERKKCNLGTPSVNQGSWLR